MNRSSSAMRRDAVRTALVSTGVVAALLLVLCISVDLLVAHNLRTAVSDRLGEQLGTLVQHSGTTPFGEPDFDDPVVSWRLDGAGRVVASSPGAPAMPAAGVAATVPQQVTIMGTDFLINGAAISGGRIVAAGSLDSVNRATGSLLVAEAVVGPLLLLLIFAGALIVGRRVAGPLERAHQAQLDFTADASHELRTPLSVIEAELSLALSQPRGMSADAVTLERVLAETHRLRRIVDDLLWLARFNATPSEPGSEPVDVATAAAVAATRFTGIAGQRGVRIALDVDPAAPAIVDAPAEWIDRLAGVLLDNACRHSPPNSDVRIAVRREAAGVRLEVADSGAGIPPEQRARIFDRFHRGHSADGGTGLGLAIGDAVVRATGGRWLIGDAPEGGASVGVVWPARRRVVDGNDVERGPRALGDGAAGVLE